MIVGFLFATLGVFTVGYSAFFAFIESAANLPPYNAGFYAHGAFKAVKSRNRRWSDKKLICILRFQIKLSCTPVRKFSLKPQYANELFVISSSSQLDGHESTMNVKFCSVETNICSMKIKTDKQTTIINLFLVNKKAEIIVPQLLNVTQSDYSGMSISPSILPLQGVLQSRNNGISICPLTMACLSVRQLRDVRQSRNYGMSVRCRISEMSYTQRPRASMSRLQRLFILFYLVTAMAMTPTTI